ncbi:collagen alpha-6(VI) chain-like, partial [Clarias magur]
PCNPVRDCPQTRTVSTPKELDMDLAMLVDGSRDIQADQYQGVKEVLRTVLDQLVVSDQPSTLDTQARVALYQQSSSYSEAQAPVKQIFTFQQFQDHNQMKHSISVNLQQTGGYSRLGHALEFVIKQGLLTASRSRKNKMVLLIVGGEAEYSDRAKLDFISMMAKCHGVVLLTLTVGDHFNCTQVEELASLPTEQHIIHLGHVKQGEQEYSQRFIRTFLHILSREMNTYPSPLLRQQCERFQQQQSQGQVHVVYEAAKRPPVQRFYLTASTYTEYTETQGVEVKSKRDKEYAEPTRTLRVYEYGHVLNSGPGDSN